VRALASDHRGEVRATRARRPPARIAAASLRGLLVASAALVFGVALAALGAATNPYVILALPLLGYWLAAVLTRPAWAIALFLAAMPFEGQRVSAGTFQVIDIVSIIAIGAVILARLVRRAPGYPPPYVLGWGAALCALAALSVPSALDTTLALDQLIVLVASFLLACAVVAACERMIDIRLLVAGFLVVGAVMSVAAFATSRNITTYGGAVVETRATGFFQDPNELGSLAAMVLMVALGVALSGLPRAYRVLGGMTAMLAISALTLSLSRGAWLGAATGLLALVILIPRAWRVLLTVAIVGLLVGLTAGAFNSDPVQVQVLGSRFGELLHPAASPYDQRTQIWAEAQREIVARPLLGFGPANFPVASARSGSRASTVGAVHAHDVLLTVGAEVGLPAVGAVVAFTVGIGWAAWRTRRRLRGKRDAAMAAGIAAALVAFMGHGLIDYTLRNATLMGVVFVLAGLVVACDRIARAPSATGR
jgi:O-antigen ligase